MNKPFFADHAHSANGCGCGGDAVSKHQHDSHSKHDCCGEVAQATPTKGRHGGCCHDSGASASDESNLPQVPSE